MASPSMISSSSTTPTPILLLLLTLSSFHLPISVTSSEFQVGADANGWVVPPANDTKIYNDWASENRFRVGDSIHFKYKKDSVLEVTETEYKKCNSTRPIFFSNTGNTVYKLDRSGFFYFISGASGHCERGQRMIIKVMSHDDSDGGSKSSASSTAAAVVLSYVVIAPLALLSYLIF